MDNSSAPQFFTGKERNPAGDIRIELGQYAARLMQRGLTSATGGNISHRDGEDMWITPLAGEIARILAIAYSLGKGEPRKPGQEEIDAYKRWFYHRQLPERP